MPVLFSVWNPGTQPSRSLVEVACAWYFSLGRLCACWPDAVRRVRPLRRHCSSPGIVKLIVGNFDVVATPPCRQHDFCYRNTYRAYRLTWGNYATLKNRCDTHFRSEMYNACDDTQDHWVSTAVCKQDARLYYSGVMKFGNLQTSS